MPQEGLNTILEVDFMITLAVKGDFKKTRRMLEKSKHMDIRNILNKYGKEGVEALRLATPKDSGKTADSWGYKVSYGHDGAAIYWTNSNIVDGVNIAIILRYGHGTGTGGYVRGRDYLSPAIQPIFDDIAESAWKEVVK